MRHLSVPTGGAQEIIQKFKQLEWISYEFKIQQIGTNILIPLSSEAPSPLPKDIVGEEVKVEPIMMPPKEGSWKQIFEKEMGEKNLSNLDDRISKGHEIIGDVMIQPAHKFQDGIPEYIDALVRAKMQAHPRIRLMLFDYGVKGKFRIRDLEIAAIRLDKIIQGEELHTLPPEVLNSETTIKESGFQIHLDPSKVYFSGKLGNERNQTTHKLLQFRDEIERPLSICDLYCGVGPNLVHLLSHKGLTSSILANDLNPECIPYLFRNLSPLKSLSPPDVDGIVQVTEEIQVANMDALDLVSDTNLHGRWDVLFVNLPHESLEHLPYLIPLLSKNNVSIIRGWGILPTEELPSLRDRLHLILQDRFLDFSFKIRKQHGATKSMIGFWIRVGPE